METGTKRVLSVGGYQTLRKLINTHLHDMDQLIKTHRLQAAYSTEDLYKYLDRGFARFMGHLVRAHQKYSNT